MITTQRRGAQPRGQGHPARSHAHAHLLGLDLGTRTTTTCRSADIVDIVLQGRPQAVSFPGANPRHGHEWKVWKDVKLPDGKIIIPGVIDSTSNFVEHPELVADRIVQYAGVVGRENVIAGVDCGFGTFAGRLQVDSKIVWMKLAVARRRRAAGVEAVVVKREASRVGKGARQNFNDCRTKEQRPADTRASNSPEALYRTMSRRPSIAIDSGGRTFHEQSRGPLRPGGRSSRAGRSRA